MVLLVIENVKNKGGYDGLYDRLFDKVGNSLRVKITSFSKYRFDRFLDLYMVIMYIF